MKNVIGYIVSLMGMLFMILNNLVISSVGVMFVLLPLLKLTGVVMIPWFSTPLVIGALSTPIWLLVFYIPLSLLGMVITMIGVEIID